MRIPFRTKEEYIRNIISIMTECKVPLSFWDEPAVRQNQRVYSELFDVSCSAWSMSLLLAAHVKEKMALQLKGKLISLKLDIVSRLKRSVLGVSVQFVQDRKLQIRYLAMVEVSSTATAEELRVIIDDCLGEYGLDKRNFYSITTDRGGRLKTTPKVTADEIAWAVVGGDLDEIRHDLENFEENENTDDELPATEDDELGEVDLDRNLHIAASVDGSQSVPCVAQAVQLAIFDFMQLENRKETMAATQAAVKEVRQYIRNTPNDRPDLPTLSMDTKWSSSYDMVSALESLDHSWTLN